jgi:TolB-like protein
MASIIPGFEYDIFISYRQKDNKGDRWVSEFVEALSTELESTFKEEISVYFDINPHDGLLETHDVDASLKEKLKCVVFIPIISRTYCDPKSFAWEHEFKAFIDQASKDQFGLKIKLPNGNVATRILPVQIHDLYPEDKALLEKELGGVLRAIEFIYKEPGVNKPLSAKDNEDKNTNKTNYRIQINKVANAIDEIIHGIRSIQVATVDKNLQPDHKVTIATKGSEVEIQKGKTLSNKNIKRWIFAGLLSIFCILCVFGILKVIERTNQVKDIAKLEKSIAVLPFVNDSPDKENEYFCNGMMEEILNNLQKIKDFRVLSRTSVEQYRGTSRPTIPKIAKALDINYIVEGSVQKYGNTFRLRVQLIAANNEKHLWGESYEQEIKETKDIFKVQSQVAQSIASELKATITSDEKQLIEKASTTNLTAYDFYQRGMNEINYNEVGYNSQSLKRSEALFKKSLEYDSTFALAYCGLAEVYLRRHYYNSYYQENYLDSTFTLANRALHYDKNLSEAFFAKGIYFMLTGNTEQTIKEFNIAIEYNPNYWKPHYYLAHHVYLWNNYYADYIKAIEHFQIAAQINHGRELPDILYWIGYSYGNFAGYPEKAKEYYDEAFKLDGDTINYFNQLSRLYYTICKNDEALELANENYNRDSANLTTLSLLGSYYMDLRQYKVSLKYYKKYANELANRGAFQAGVMMNIGYAYWQNGLIEDADYYFKEHKRLSEEAIKKGRDYSSWGYAYAGLAEYYAFKGDKEKAYENLRIFTNLKACPLFDINLLKDSPLWDYLRNDKEFQTIIIELESKYQAEHERVRKWLEEQGKL